MNEYVATQRLYATPSLGYRSCNSDCSLYHCRTTINSKDLTIQSQIEERDANIAQLTSNGRLDLQCKVLLQLRT